MNIDYFKVACSPDAFLPTNARSLDLPPMTRSMVETIPRVGQVIHLKDGTPALQVDQQLLGMPLPYDDLKRALRGISESTLFIVFGLGMGHVPRALRALTRSPVIVYEPDAGILRTVLESGPLDLADIPIVSTLADLAVVWSRYAGQRREAVVVNTPGYRSLFEREAAALPDTVQRLVERVTITKNTYRKRARVWVNDILENIELLSEHPPALALINQYAGVPAFIIGAGPSLDKNIRQLSRAVRKGLVFATNSSALALSKLGIIPQFLLCIESIDISQRLETIPFLDQTIRMFSLSASPKTMRTGKGPLLPFYEALPQYCLPLEDLLGVPGVGVCGSVSTAAFSIAQKLGCGPIVLVGQDMAFTAGKTYAGGTGYESSRAEFNTQSKHIRLDWNDTIKQLHGTQHGSRHEFEPLLEVEAWGGGTVTSGPSLTAVNSWLESSAAMAAQFQPGLRLINATEGGSRVKGFEEMPLEALLDTLPDLDIGVESIVARARELRGVRTPEELHAWATSQAALTSSTRRRARRTKRLGKHALSAIGSDQPRNITRAFGALDKAELELKHAVARAPLIDAWSHGEVDDLLRQQGTDGSNSTRDARAAAQSAVALGTNVAEAIETASAELEVSLNNLLMRLTEDHTTKGSLPCL
jgi:Protein of unknown function DUF115